MARIMRKSKDRRVFRKTAIDRKKINVNPVVPRGGICL